MPAHEQLPANPLSPKARESLVLGRLAAQFNQRLAALQAPDVADKVAAVFDRKGKLVKRPKAGASS